MNVPPFLSLEVEYLRAGRSWSSGHDHLGHAALALSQAEAESEAGSLRQRQLAPAHAHNVVQEDGVLCPRKKKGTRKKHKG